MFDLRKNISIRSKLESFVERLEPGLYERFDACPKPQVNDVGVDPYGFDPNMLRELIPLALWVYRKYFRCDVSGFEHIPEGRVLLVGNHSGQLPFDGMMVATSMMVDAPQPRLVRGMVERWSAELPYLSSLFVRMGQVVGTPKVCRELLQREEAVMVFPEGVRGVNKLFRNRYQLQGFGRGFMRVAIESQTPVVPFAVIGAEEQAPSIANIEKLAKLFKVPAFPLIFPQILPFPLPVKYRIRFGDVVMPPKCAPDDLPSIQHAVHLVEHRIRTMIENELVSREGWFA